MEVKRWTTPWCIAPHGKRSAAEITDAKHGDAAALWTTCEVPCKMHGLLPREFCNTKMRQNEFNNIPIYFDNACKSVQCTYSCKQPSSRKSVDNQSSVPPGFVVVQKQLDRSDVLGGRLLNKSACVTHWLGQPRPTLTKRYALMTSFCPNTESLTHDTRCHTNAPQKPRQWIQPRRTRLHHSIKSSYMCMLCHWMWVGLCVTNWYNSRPVHNELIRQQACAEKNLYDSSPVHHKLVWQ